MSALAGLGGRGRACGRRGSGEEDRGREAVTPGRSAREVEQLAVEPAGVLQRQEVAAEQRHESRVGQVARGAAEIVDVGEVVQHATDDRHRERGEPVMLRAAAHRARARAGSTKSGEHREFREEHADLQRTGRLLAGHRTTLAPAAEMGPVDVPAPGSGLMRVHHDGATARRLGCHAATVSVRHGRGQADASPAVRCGSCLLAPVESVASTRGRRPQVWSSGSSAANSRPATDESGGRARRLPMTEGPTSCHRP